MGTEFCSNNGVRFVEDENPVENIVEIRQRGRCVREDSYTVEGGIMIIIYCLCTFRKLAHAIYIFPAVKRKIHYKYILVC